MSSACPSCGSPLAADANQCRACKRVFGEDNRCPHCDAYAPARWNGVSLSCSACDKPRDRKPKTVVIEEKGGSGEVLTAKAGSLALTLAGVTGFAFSGLSLITAVAGFAWLGFVAGTMSLGLAAGFAVFGTWAWRRGRAASAAVVDRDAVATELRILSLAEQNAGVLSVTDVVRGLGVQSAKAESILNGLVDGSRVTMEVDSNGAITYQFRELQKALPAPRVRVETADVVEADVASVSEQSRKQSRE